MRRNETILLMLVFFMVLAFILMLPWAQATGEQRGAKIALAADTGYRLEEVRGSCEDLFGKDECIKCHDLKEKK